MKNFLLSLILSLPTFIFAGVNKCSSNIEGYKIYDNLIYPFVVNKEKACFFVFFTTNPDPSMDTKGQGNLGDALWYGYYKVKNPHKIYEFPKPHSLDWSMVCSIEAVSFYPMHNNKQRDVTVIGSCDKQNVSNLNFPFVFIWKKDRYVLDEDVFNSLYGFISLTVADIKAYIKSPKICYKILRDRFDREYEGKFTCG